MSNQTPAEPEALKPSTVKNYSLLQSLMESRLKYKSYPSQGMDVFQTNTMDLLGIERGLEGVAVIDSGQVIAKFRNKLNQAYEESHEYNLLGKVPVVNTAVAKAYMKLHEA